MIFEKKPDTHSYFENPRRVDPCHHPQGWCVYPRVYVCLGGGWGGWVWGGSIAAVRGSRGGRRLESAGLDTRGGWCVKEGGRSNGSGALEGKGGIHREGLGRSTK